MKYDYRNTACDCLRRASVLLEDKEDEKLSYACLELRKCIEALSYDLFTSYLQEVSLKAFEAWQPDKVIKELLRVDPEADKGSHMRFKREGQDGAPDGPWIYMGEERRLRAKRVEKIFNQLGSFLHVPTIKQSNEGRGADSNTIRTRAEAIKEELSHVLSSKIWNANFGEFVSFNCSECEAPIKRRASVLEPEGSIECGQCGQEFTSEPLENGAYKFIPLSYSWDCPTCGAFRDIPRSHAKDGLAIDCPHCKHQVNLSFVQKWILVERSSG